jgi:hypothetical protein
MNNSIMETANWKTQYLQTFSSSGLAGDDAGNLVSWNVTGGSADGTSPIGVGGGTVWVDSGATVSYTFVNPITSNATGKQYRYSTASDPASGYSVSSGNTVTGNYVAQYYLTVKTDPPGLVTIPGQGWYDEGTIVTLTAPGVWGRYRLLYWDVDGTSQGNFVNPITVTMSLHTATAHYSNSAVGGQWAPVTMQIIAPVNAMQVLAPWIALALLVAASALAAIRRLPKKH